MASDDMPIKFDRLLELFRRMLNIYSPSGKEEELCDYLREYLAGHGLATTKQAVDKTRFNLLISTGRKRPRTLFLGHIDTVPAFDIEQYGCTSRGELYYGLGAADMKSGCAALIEAFLIVALAGRLPDTVLLALVVGEEESGDGTKTLLDEYCFEDALVAEPTDLKPCLDHYGYVEMNVRAFGNRRHAAMSGRDTNAIRAMLRFLLRLEDRLENEEPDTVLNIRDLNSSEAGFAVPDRCAASIDLHIPPDIRADTYVAALSPFVDAELVRSGALRHELDFPTIANGYRTDANDPLPRRLQAVHAALNKAWEPVAFTSHSDANLLRDAGCRPVMLGPGQLAKAHTRDESVATGQVAAAAQIYARLLAAMQGTHAGF